MLNEGDNVIVASNICLPYQLLKAETSFVGTVWLSSSTAVRSWEKVLLLQRAAAGITILSEDARLSLLKFICFSVYLGLVILKLFFAYTRASIEK